MTIKSKLTLNVITVLLIIGSVSVTSIIGMSFIKNKLFYLTERSTPYQMRTMELQRAIQGATSDLVKTSMSKNQNDLKLNRQEAEKTLSDVRNTQDVLEALSGNEKMTTYEELHGIAKEIFEITEERLNAENEANTSNKIIMQRLTDASGRLNELDVRIKSLQSSSYTGLRDSLGDAKNISNKLRQIELFRMITKDLQLALFELQKSKDKKAFIIARGKINTSLSQALLNEYVRDSKTVLNYIKSTEEKAEELGKLQSALFGQTDDETKNSFDAIVKNISDNLSSVLQNVEQDAMLEGEKYGVENRRQSNVLLQSGIANDVLMSNSELVMFGFSIKGLSAKLFTLTLVKDVDSVENEIKKTFEGVEYNNKRLEKHLSKLEAKEEIKLLQNVHGSLNSARNLLFAKDGVIAKVRHKMNMDAKAVQMTEKLKEIVVKQAEKGKQTVTTAQGEQEKAIGTVNRMVRFSTILISIISLGAVIFGIFFGTWVYRSIAGPLNNLIRVADNVAGGDLKTDISEKSDDELGRVQMSMSKMVTNLREIVGKIRTATGNLAGSSEELSATASALDKGSQEQAKQIEQSATAMTEMSQTVMDVSKNASNTADASQKMKITAIKGKDAMDITMKELKKFADTFKDSASKVESLGQKSDEINKVVRIIKEIADQTNLLALNAAIEAARAGEQGRGFAVVADNVRQLAERTASATDEIANTVRTMQAEVGESVGFMREEKDNVEKVLGSLKTTLSAIDEIVRYVEQVADMIQRIAAATDQQSTASEDVSRNMEGIASITRQLSGSFSEIRRSSEDLSRIATELNSMAGWFKA